VRIRIADARSFASLARRSRVLQLVLAAVAVALAVTAFAMAPRTTHPSDPLLRGDESTIVVVDLSASISWDTYARIATTLDQLRRSGGRAGLILFSDTAYQALPPRTPVAQLAAFERFFVVKQPTQPGFAPQPPHSPWSDDFSSGTRISTGLELALRTIEANHLRKPRVLLISDLDDDTSDIESLTSVGLAYRHLGVPISVAALDPSPQDVATMQRLLPQGGAIVDVPLQLQPRQVARAGVAWRLVALLLLLAAVLGALALVTQRLRWVAP
jgi:hypothetical protein